jgi:hypothetical protein
MQQESCRNRQNRRNRHIEEEEICRQRELQQQRELQPLVPPAPNSESEEGTTNDDAEFEPAVQELDEGENQMMKNKKNTIQDKNKLHKVEDEFDLLIDWICWQDRTFLAKTGQITSVAAIPSRRFVQVF